MKFTLKDYQAEAVDLLLERLQRAQSDYRLYGTRSSVSLCATTGAGKTVMSAAVIEALFNGTDEFDADDGAVVVWFSDDPNLNEQTKDRLLQASDRLSFTDLVTIEPPFSQPRLEPGKVYFLNTQKLSVTSKLTRGARDSADDKRFEQFQQPDDQAWTIWDTLNDTILDDELTLYLFLDEAHRGFGARTSKDKGTIVSRLVNGSDVVTPAPIVIGVSATIDKFETAMTEADFLQDRQALEPVRVDGASVQESGLLKDTVVLDFTTETGVFDRALVRRGAEKLKSSTEAWREYAASQNDPHAAVTPLMVLQVPNRPDPDLIGGALDVIAEVMPSVTQAAVRHVLGDHSAQEFGSWTVNWMEPQRVEERTDVRVLVAKEAISTGWDCPRAEVMVSFRTAKEHTHITQILGRMVRNPLARRVPGDDRLNSVNCLLPYFDRTTAGKVVRFLTGQVADVPGAGKKVLLDGREMGRNPVLDDEELWDAWRATPTQLLPQRGVRPVSRLLQFATELERDGIRPGACESVAKLVLRELAAAAIRYERQLVAARAEVLTVRGMSIAGTTGEATLAYSDFAMHADDQAVAIAFKAAKAAFSDVARAFVDQQVKGGAVDDFSNPIRDAMVEAAALATVPAIRETLDAAANERFDRREHEHRHSIAALSDLRRERYREIKAQAPDPQVTTLVMPRSRLEDFQELDANDDVSVAPLVGKHLMSDDDGNFPLSKLNAWERKVILAEVARESLVAWYRNPPRSAGDSVCIAYRNEFGNWRGLYPDFILFERVEGRILPSIVDPHRFDLDDALIKLLALADFAGDFGDKFHRIESLAEVGGTMRVLNLKSERVRKDVKYFKGEVVDLYKKAGELRTATAPSSSSRPVA